jgi:solute carrier family 25 carnitine/acylcarnitine transporter 20/29
MSADFWAGYLSGATGIIIGNPLDLIKTRIQAGHTSPTPSSSTTEPPPSSFKGHFDRAGTLVRGALFPTPYTISYTPREHRHSNPHTHSTGTTAPILGYGALNAILFVTYNRTLTLLDNHPDPVSPYPHNLLKVWCAGAAGGLATFVVSAPTELIKCRAQVATGNVGSWSIARDTWMREGIRGLYYGGGITSIRDAVGYGF